LPKSPAGSTGKFGYRLIEVAQNAIFMEFRIFVQLEGFRRQKRNTIPARCAETSPYAWRYGC
jgi:hypothetical protein